MQFVFDSHSVEPGDLVISATDGLFDNLHDYEIEDLLARFPCDSVTELQDCATELADFAFEASITRNRDTPYSRAASSEFDMFYQGGKKDDITVVIGKVIDI